MQNILFFYYIESKTELKNIFIGCVFHSSPPPLVIQQIVLLLFSQENTTIKCVFSCTSIKQKSKQINEKVMSTRSGFCLLLCFLITILASTFNYAPFLLPHWLSSFLSLHQTLFLTKCPPLSCLESSDAVLAWLPSSD